MDDARGAQPQFIIGDYLFSINTAAAQELRRNTEYRWAEHELVGEFPAHQFIGPGADTIEIPGVVYCAWRGGIGQLDAMRAVGLTGEPQPLLDGAGHFFGRWVIEGISETATEFLPGGIPLKQEFSMQLRKFDGEDGGGGGGGSWGLW